MASRTWSRIFKKDGELYAVARRNISESGRYDVASSPFRMLNSIRNQLNYITTGKRCAIWHFAPGKNQLAFVTDLPSRGDTCFPSVIDDPSSDTVAIYDYSSPTHGADPPWSVGQRKPTYIYRHEVQFTRSSAMSRARASAQ